MTEHKNDKREFLSVAAGPFLPLVLSILLFLFCAERRARAGAQQPATSPAVVDVPLSTERVVENLVAMNLERAQSLHAYEVTETYRMEYRGFPGARNAEMVVDVKYRSPGPKQFTIQSQTGSRLLIDKVFRRLLRAQEQVLGTEAQKRTALNKDNYTFTSGGYENALSGVEYVLHVSPITKDTFLYRGRIWVDTDDFAVVRLEAEPAKNPSFWTRDVRIEQTYEKVGDFWLPARVHSVTAVRLGGSAEMTIQYSNYVITSADPVGNARNVMAEAAHGQRTTLQAKAVTAKE